MGGGPCPPLLGGRRAGGRRATFGCLADVESVRHRPLFREPAVLDPPELVLGPVHLLAVRLSGPAGPVAVGDETVISDDQLDGDGDVADRSRDELPERLEPGSAFGEARNREVVNEVLRANLVDDVEIAVVLEFLGIPAHQLGIGHLLSPVVTGFAKYWRIGSQCRMFQWRSTISLSGPISPVSGIFYVRGPRWKVAPMTTIMRFVPNHRVTELVIEATSP